MELRKTGQFTCRDAHGREYTVIERRHVVKTPSGKEMLGTRDYVTANGEDVSELNDNSFEIVRSGIKLQRG